MTADLAIGLLHFAGFAAVGCCFVHATRLHRETLDYQTRLFLWAISIRFVVTLMIYEVGLIDTLKDEDGGGWGVGAAYCQAWRDQGYGIVDAPLLFLKAYQRSNCGYFYFLGIFFLFTGMPNRLPAAGLNCLLGALAIVFTYRLARCLFAERVARQTAWFACFFPSLLIWSSQTIKEPIVIFLETVALYSCVALRVSGFSLSRICLIGAAALLMYPLRFYAAYITGGVVLISLALPRFGGKSTFLAAVLVIVLIVGFVGFSGIQVTKELHQHRFDVEYVSQFKEGGTIGNNSGVKIDTELNTPGGLGFALLIGAAHLLFAPFPWQWGLSLRMVLVVPEVVFWWGLLLYGGIAGLWHSVRHRLIDVLPLLLFILGMGLLYSLLFGNIGLIYRQRAQLMPWLLIFAAVGIQLRRTVRPTRPFTVE